TPQTLELSAELMRAGADKERITDEIFGNKRIAAIKLLGEVLAEMRFSSEGRYCYSYIDEAMLERTGADGEDSEDIVNTLLRIEGVHAAALFKAFDGEIRVSLRSDGSINVQSAAAKLLGGGHYRASGLTYVGPLAEAFTAVESALVGEGLDRNAIAG
ncbi:MAG TPA: DHHA1 domain-containing protein, partial [Candidatus Dormibacteraeota bacterium]|nr:DHHA1 domain-containing protein [Candidatus Dormibacteraeota bacterium]